MIGDIPIFELFFGDINLDKGIVYLKNRYDLGFDKCTI